MGGAAGGQAVACANAAAEPALFIKEPAGKAQTTQQANHAAHAVLPPPTQANPICVISDDEDDHAAPAAQPAAAVRPARATARLPTFKKFEASLGGEGQEGLRVWARERQQRERGNEGVGLKERDGPGLLCEVKEWERQAPV